MRKKSSILILSVIIVIATFITNDNYLNVHGNNSNTINKILVRECNCLKSDTTLQNGDYVKYSIVDSQCIIAIRLHGEQAFLPNTYKCPLSELDIPTFYDTDSNSIYFIKGSGFSFREIIVCEYIHDSIVINSYVTNKSEDTNLDVFIFKKQIDKSQVFIKGIFDLQQNEGYFVENGRRIINFTLPAEFHDEVIKFTDVEPTFININFKSGKSYKIKYIKQEGLVKFY